MAKADSTHQQRLLDGMAFAAARYGYADASVARVIEQAGVSRATFYEHFSDKEDCFLATYRSVAERVGLDVRRVERSGLDRPREILAGLLENTDRDPAAARLVLIEALAGEPAVRAEHELLLDAIEGAVDRYLDGGPEGAPRLEIPARAIVGGVCAVMAVRVFRGETGRLIELLDDLVAWIESYTVPAGWNRHRAADWSEMGRKLPSPASALAGEQAPPPRLPRGRGALSRGEVASEHRARILAATARLAWRKGYAAMTVADIVSEASVAREVFYELFRNKEDAFLAVQTAALQESISVAAGEFFGGESWPDRVWDGLRAMLGYVAEHPDLACVDIVESYTAGPAAIRRSFDNRMSYSLFLQDGYRQGAKAQDLPQLCSDAIGGAIGELMRRQVLAERTEQMVEILPQAAYVALAPFIGAMQAMEKVKIKVAETRAN